jgi:hypothetical protein
VGGTGTAYWGPRGGPLSSRAETIAGLNAGSAVNYFDAMDDSIAVADSILMCSYEVAETASAPFPATS